LLVWWPRITPLLVFPLKTYEVMTCTNNRS